jgi:tetratricopeptide (TPR) repeat protein
MAISGFLERPVFGWGQESFNFVFNKYYDPRMFGQEQWFDRTHDVVLDWLISGGLVGFLAYASMFVAFFYYVWRKKSSLKLSEKSILTGMFAAFIFHNIFVFDNLISYIMFFSFLAYVHAVSVEKQEATGQFHVKKLSNGTIYGSVAGVGVLVVCAVYFVNIPAILANKTLIQAISPQSGGAEKNIELFKKVFAYNSFGSTEAIEQLVQVTGDITASQIPDTLKQQFYDLAKSKIVEKVASSPTDARYLVFAGSFFDRFGQYDESIPYLERAIKESPGKQTIYFELGSAYLGKGNTNKMFELFKQAYQLSTTSQESRIIYAIGAMYTKNVKVLQELSPLIPKDIVVHDERFLQTYAKLGDYNSVTAILTARLAEDPNNSQTKLSLASAYTVTGQKQKAIDIIRDMIAKDPNFKAQGEQYIQQINAK